VNLWAAPFKKKKILFRTRTIMVWIIVRTGVVLETRNKSDIEFGYGSEKIWCLLKPRVCEMIANLWSRVRSAWTDIPRESYCLFPQTIIFVFGTIVSLLKRCAICVRTHKIRITAYNLQDADVSEIWDVGLNTFQTDALFVFDFFFCVLNLKTVL